MNERLKLQIFSNFYLKSSKGMVSSESARSQQVIKLLVYILINREREISHQELIEVLWEDKHTGNPAGALKNLAYRLRNMLRTLGEEEYLTARQGFYRWNSDIWIDADYEQFEELCDSAKMIRDEEAKEHMYCEAFAIYKGSIQKELASERWMVPVTVWYQSMYLSAARELIQIYAKGKKFSRIQQICMAALEINDLEQDFHYWLLRSLMEQHKVDLALKEYNEATQLSQKHLGLKTSELLSQVYREMTSMKNAAADSRSIIETLAEAEEQECVYFCEFDIFREIFRVEAKRAQRNKHAAVEYILLFTMTSKDGCDGAEGENLYDIRNGMERLEEVLRNNLRAGDVVSRYSDSQFVTMISACKEEHALRVGSRIIENLFTQYSGRKVQLRCELLMEGNNVITIS